MSNPRPNILFLVHRTPYPPNQGDRIRSFNLLKFLAARSDVYLAFLTDKPVPQESMSVLRRLCAGVAAVRLGRLRRWLHGAWSFGAGRTATEGLFFSRKLKRLLARWAETTRFDAVLAFCSSMVQYLDVPGLDDVPTVVDLVDVDSQKWLDYARHSRGPLRQAFQVEGKRLRRLEASLPNRVEAVTLVSPQEAELYQSFCPNDRAFVIRNGVDLDYFRPDWHSNDSARNQCVFVGALDYRANVDGATWFCNEVWPRVLERHPQAVFRLVGSNPGRAVRQLAKEPGIELVGQVPDVRPYLTEATAAVVPLRVARGLQNKVLEAMAMGRPVIAAPQALEGIGATPGTHVCRAVTPEEWVDHLGRLFTNADLRNRIARAARSFVEEHFQWTRRLQPLAGLPGLREHLNGPAFSPLAQRAV
ncbi:MAG: TIGR03087 family PEP-CTERM/XrtA system glycosyltransferase [Planctomycetota bacterium]|jgi:sugar transferase (PEP-CTERM/EpsH1 system associated)